MADKTPGKEFLELAIEIERNGAKFYETAAKNKEKDVSDLLTYLAEQKRKHEHTFRDMLTRMGGYVSENPCEDYEYIRRLADSSIFTRQKTSELLQQKDSNEYDVLDAGLGFEKDEILFFSEVRGMLPREEQSILDTIVKTEKKHLNELMTMHQSRFKGG